MCPSYIQVTDPEVLKALERDPAKRRRAMKSFRQFVAQRDEERQKADQARRAEEEALRKREDERRRREEEDGVRADA